MTHGVTFLWRRKPLLAFRIKLDIAAMNQNQAMHQNQQQDQKQHPQNLAAEPTGNYRVAPELHQCNTKIPNLQNTWPGPRPDKCSRAASPSSCERVQCCLKLLRRLKPSHQQMWDLFQTKQCSQPDFLSEACPVNFECTKFFQDKMNILPKFT